MSHDLGQESTHRHRSSRVGWLALGVLLALGASVERASAGEVTANVVALDQPFFWNRLGAYQPQGMMYALRRDVIVTADTEVMKAKEDHYVDVDVDEASCDDIQVIGYGDSAKAGDVIVKAGPNGIIDTDPGTKAEKKAIPKGSSLYGPDLDDDDVGALGGNVQLRPDKRPRPLVLRVGTGDTLTIRFTNLLGSAPADEEQPATREASINILGMQLEDENSFGVNVGNQYGAVVPPGGSTTYSYYAEREGVYHILSGGAMSGGEGNGGSLNSGLFGALHVEPAGSRWFRSQVTAADLEAATTGYTAAGQPILDYDKLYPANATYLSGDAIPSGTPILEIVDASGEIVHSDLNAIIVPNPAVFSYPLNPLYPGRDKPFREFTVIYHDELGAVQAFDLFNQGGFQHVLHGVQDAFAMNYGTGGIGAEIIANRLGLGPMKDCVECKYEEFFLTSWVVSDPAQVVDLPANASDPAAGVVATKALYPDDPSNVHHSYIYDHVKMRLLHGGSKEHHIHHLHAHQWGKSPDADNTHYLDSQAFGPGSAFTLEMVWNGSGNRNQTVGDSIFHCHFYPHFAMGMWQLWRVHDVYETGTPIGADGKPLAGSRALPDGEILAGTPIPAIVPLPDMAMPPMPNIDVAIVDGQVQIEGKSAFDVTDEDLTVGYKPDSTPILGNPGYPFFIPGVAGHRPPHPPMDFAVDELSGEPIDGGLPRHVVVTDPNNHAESVQTLFDFTKEILAMKALQVPEEGLPIEKAAMSFHGGYYDAGGVLRGVDPDGDGSARTIASTKVGLDGTVSPGNFIVNGQPAVAGAPFAEPCIDDFGNLVVSSADIAHGADDPRLYKAAVIQTDVVLNKVGWHFPQSRLITLWGDVDATFSGERAPEPFFFRANSQDCIEFWHTNLTPNVYEVDDFQVRTPTDILGQHIHLVKFDVTSSDGSGNGYNYEDGTYSPDEVVERIHALNHFEEPDPIDPTNNPPIVGGFINLAGQREELEPKPHPFFGAGPASPQSQAFGVAGAFVGAQTTVQRWFADTVSNLAGKDRTLRTVFTHDHYGPSTHQQAGLYAGLLIEPKDTTWHDPVTGEVMGNRFDGGPTSWRVDVHDADTSDGDDSYREFMFEFADFQLAYDAGSHEGAYDGTGPTFANTWAGLPDGQQPGLGAGVGQHGLGLDDRPFSINPPGKVEVPLDAPQGPILLEKAQQLVFDNGGVHPGPIFPEAISADDPGTYSVNYRNEPVATRVLKNGQLAQAAGLAGDLAHVFRSDVQRDIQALNTAADFWPYNPQGTPAGPAIQTADQGKLPGDPYTPLLRAYENDHVQIRTLVGAHEEGHNFALHGLKWLNEPSWKNSGYHASQMMGISEHFEFNAPADVVKGGQPFMDFIYNAGASVDNLWNGNWGLFRVYPGQVGAGDPPLQPLPNNPDGKSPARPGAGSKRDPNPDGFNGPCPVSAPVRSYKIRAVLARDVLAGVSPNPQSPAEGTLVYNSRAVEGGPLHDPTAILYFRQDQGGEKGDIDKNGVLRAGAPVEPLILRANAGDCIEVDLTNGLPATSPDLPGFNTMPMIVEGFNANQVAPSSHVGLHAQLVKYDGNKPASRGKLEGGSGITAGFNSVGTAAPGETVKYRWYAGDVRYDEGQQKWVATPIEFGAVNLIPADPIKHSNKGAVGALIVEPKGATWAFEDTDGISGPDSRATATVYPGPSVDANGQPNPQFEAFREFVAVFQNDVNLRFGSDASGLALTAFANQNVDRSAGAAVPNTFNAEDPEDSAQKAINYGTEPTWFRLGYAPDAPLNRTRELNFSMALHNDQVGGSDPETPVFTATAGQPVRFRVLEPAGHARNHVFAVFGHVWQELPYINESTQIGDNKNGAKWMTTFEGSRMGHGPTNHFDAVLQNGAGGINGVPGDYLWRDMASFQFDGGMWGILRVND